MSIQLIGLFAGLCTTAAWVPQLVRTWKRGSTEDLSWSYLLVFATGVSSWIAYGLLARDVPVVAANTVSILFIGLLVLLKDGAGVRSPSRKVVRHEQPDRPWPVKRRPFPRARPSGRRSPDA